MNGIAPSNTDAIDGQARTTEPNIEACKTRCANVEECVYWTYWVGVGGCHLSPGGAKFVGDISMMFKAIIKKVFPCGQLFHSF